MSYPDVPQPPSYPYQTTSPGVPNPDHPVLYEGPKIEDYQGGANPGYHGPVPGYNEYGQYAPHTTRWPQFANPQYGMIAPTTEAPLMPGMGDEYTWPGNNQDMNVAWYQGMQQAGRHCSTCYCADVAATIRSCNLVALRHVVPSQSSGVRTRPEATHAPADAQPQQFHIINVPEQSRAH